jgi:hypothetical protein
MRRRIVVVTVGLAIVLMAASGAAADVDPLSVLTGPTPFGPGCNRVPQTGTLYPNAEVEPWVEVNPARRTNLIAVWQQDRWDNGGAQGNLTGVSDDRGRTWSRPKPPPFSRCAGGKAANGGDYERATDPWVSFSPNGHAHQIALSFNDSNPINAVLVSNSRDGGHTWEPIKTLIRDTDIRFFNDKESITADPTDSRYVYAVWDRLFVPDPAGETFFGPTLFTRSTNGGRTWERPRVILDPGENNQTIGNQIAVLPNGDLINAFDLIIQDNLHVAVQRSTNKGRTWSRPVIVSPLGTIFVVDPRDGAPVRTEDILPEIAVDPRKGKSTVYLVWQDARFTGADQVVLSRSTNGGRTWSAPKLVSENPATQAFTPSVEVDPQGNVGVTYYDFTADTVASPTLDTDYWFTRSGDRGATFSARERVTATSFDMRSAPFAGGFFVGDYEGLDSAGRTFKPVFGVANTGNQANPTDMLATTVRPPFSGMPAAEVLSRVGAADTRRTPGRLRGRAPARRR